MKILMYSDCFIFGGSENVIENLLKSSVLSANYNLFFYYADSKRYEASVKDKFPAFKNIHAVPILSVFNKWGYDAMLKQTSIFKKIYLNLGYTAGAIVEKLYLYDLINFLTLYKLFKTQSPDILYINNGGYPGAASCRIAVLSAKKARIKQIIFNVNNLALPPKGFIDKWLDKKIIKGVKFFITASNAARETLIEQRKFPASKCISIPNTLSKNKEEKSLTITPMLRKDFQIDNNIFILGSAGLLTKRKGFIFLIEACKILRDNSISGFQLFIFGEGEERTKLEIKIKEYGLSEIVILAGHKKDIENYIKDVNVYICPSVANEDFPYSILEAMLLAKPVIGTNIAGIPEQIINNHNGFIVAPGNAEEIANKIKILLSSIDVVKVMGENSLKRYRENFNNANIIDRYNQLFKKLSTDQFG